MTARSDGSRAFATLLTRPSVPDSIVAARSVCPALEAVPDEHVEALLTEIRALSGQARDRALHDWWLTVSAWNTPGFAQAITALEHGWHHEFTHAPPPERTNPVAGNT